ncbi:peptidase S1 [Stakelama sediminis]|uniref:Carboxypeptidase C (Cathepsin A) n=1 Tax=Stakelama sediminis TaxID=463200 RepID=A0A840YX98_9SPHN|nr:peptidase S10 [Stakelama sediminis]MBB5718177.1 carboxypeptidase C (cathepsin A) [Stakelama sediminis]
MRLSAAITLAACLALSSPALAQQKQGDHDSSSASDINGKDQAKDIADHWANAPVKEITKTHTGKAVVDGRTIPYTATAGTLTIRNAKGEPEASFFYTAYTSPGKHRPVTFFWNGGPGSATLWLRMGSFAPEILNTTDPVTVPPAPLPIKSNPDTLIGSTDMVFLDAVGTGYSRRLGNAPAKDFYGTDADIESFTKAIKRYLTINKRWNDPKYIYGESYGTTRAAGLSLALEDAGVAINGVMLQSTILNYGVDQPGYDEVYIGYLPTFAAVAWYHNMVPNKPSDLAGFVERARQFASGPYAAALAKGQDISPQEEDQIAQQLHDFIGLPVAYLKQANLRVTLSHFRKELLRNQYETVGRFDGRYIGTDTDSVGARPGYDASDTSINQAYVSGFMDRLTREFDYKTDLNYRLSVWDSRDFDWDFSHVGPNGRKEEMVDVAQDLSKAMRTNPHLRVLSLNGYYDMATPFFSTERDLKHMMIPRTLDKNLEFKYYPAGHMIYLNPKARHEMRLDLQRFYAQGS